MKRCFKQLILPVVFLLSLFIVNPLFSQDEANTESEITGYYVIKPNDCFQKNFKGKRNTHMLMDNKTLKGLELDVTDLDMKKIKTGKSLKVRGFMKTKNVGTKDKPKQKKFFKAKSIKMVEVESGPAKKDGSATSQDSESTEEDGTPTASETTEPPPKAEAVTTTDFNCLLLFCNTSDYTVNQTKKTTTENYLFGTGDNVAKGFSSSTYSYYTLAHSETVVLDMTSETASAHDSDSMYNAMKTKATSLGYNMTTGNSKPYQRIFFFMPNNLGESFTAWAYVDGIGGSWCHSVYSYNWTGAYCDGHAHENSHNCGFQHSNEGGTEYGDETCVMGYSHSGSNGSTMSTLNPVKKAQLGVFDGYPGTKVDLSGDSTMDMYPLAIHPDTQAGVRCVTFAGTDYYISYRRDLSPYGKIWNGDSAKRDKVVIYTNTAFNTYSYLAGYINEGGTYNAGDVTIKFERYGDAGKNYATVSFDLNDGNTKPVADPQSPTTEMNTAKAITLTGSDADNGETLTYAVVTNPSNGALSGTSPNLTYTPNASYTGADSFVFKVDDGDISSFATVSITVTEPTGYTVTYDDNGSDSGSVPTDGTSYNENDPVTVLGNTGNLVKSGNTFVGWNTQVDGNGTTYVADDTFNMGTSNVTLYAKWTALPTYTVSFNGNGNTGGSAPGNQTKIEDITLVLSAQGSLVKTGYSFTGWNTQAGGGGTAYAAGGNYTANAATTLYAQWAALPTYTVSYSGNGNTGGTAPGDQTKTQGIDLTLASNSGSLVKTGYAFMGWNTAANGTGTDYAEGANYTLDSALSLYAKWNVNPVVSAGDDDTVYMTGNDVPWTPADTTTAAWFDAQDSATLWEDTGGVTPATTVVGRWDDKSGNDNHVTQSTVARKPTLISNDPLANNLPSVFSGDDVVQHLIASSQAPSVKTAYIVCYYADGVQATVKNHPAIFASTDGAVRLTGRANETTLWDYTGDNKNFDNFNNTGGETYVDGSTTDVDGTTSLPLAFTLWKVISNTAHDKTWKLLANGTSGWNNYWGGLSEIIFTDGTETLADQQKIEGYLAHKWGITAKLPGGHPYKTNPPMKSVASATATLAGQVTDSDDTPTNTWSDTGTGTGTGTVTFVDENVLNTDVSFTDTGTYILRLSSDDGNAVVTDDVTITVEDPPTYTVTYNGNGSDSGNVPIDGNNPYDVDETVTVLGNTGSLLKTEYTFAGWNTAAGGGGTPYAADDTFSISADTTLYAQWIANQYTITFDSDGGTAVSDITQDYNSAVTPPANPTKTGYTFASWSPSIPANMPAGGLACTAQWTINQYTITFDSDGGSAVSDITQDYNSPVTPPADPTKTGYTFASWSPSVPANMPAGGLNVTAQWTHDGTPHDADTNNDWSISQGEVESFITAYNGNDNTVTTVNGDITADRITMREVMRVIYLYNGGTGGYIYTGSGTDGYDIEVVAQGAPQAAPEATVETGDEGDGSVVVSSTADSGVGSLRDAIAIAADGETITIDSSVDTIKVLSEIVIDKSITIDGSGAAIVSGEKQTRIFRIENEDRDINITIKNIGIVDAENNSDEFGGAVYNNGQTLTLDTVLFDGNANTATHQDGVQYGKGGAVYSSGTLNVDNCVFTNNTASKENDVYQE